MRTRQVPMQKGTNVRASTRGRQQVGYWAARRVADDSLVVTKVAPRKPKRDRMLKHSESLMAPRTSRDMGPPPAEANFGRVRTRRAEPKAWGWNDPRWG